MLNDGCLRMTSWSAAGGTAKAKGRELQPLFEHGLVLTLRGEDGAADRREAASRPRRASSCPTSRATRCPGGGAGRMPFTVPSQRRAMLEAWSSSAKDGSLDCLVQTPVLLKP